MATVKLQKLKKNNVINFSKTWHTYVPRGALSMDGINFWG